MIKTTARILKRNIQEMSILLFCLLLLNSCASLYFQNVNSPKEPLKLTDLGDLPYREIWSGFVFNGEKVGFTHLKIEPVQEENLFRITSEAHMLIRFLGLEKQINMKSIDTVRPDLTLVSFHYVQKMGEQSLVLNGKTMGGNLRVVQQVGNQTKILEKKVEGPIYSATIINLYPLLHGLKIGAKYRYQVFDPQVQDFVEVSQSVDAFEESPELHIEPSFKVKTRMHDHSVSSWINVRGETIFEMAMAGVLITYKEEKERAKRFLSEASLNKTDLILDYSLVRTDNPIPCPRKATYLKISLDGVLEQLPLLSGPGQKVEETKVKGRVVAVYRLRSGLNRYSKVSEASSHRDDLQKYLASSNHIESDDPEIKKVANEIVAGAKTPLERVHHLVTWVSDEVEDEMTESVSALQVLHQRRGECQAHTMLYTALARAEGIPTRLVGGLVYMEDMGFLYHSWAESYLDDWIAVDPTFDQVGVDATHIKLVEGGSWLSVLKVGKVIGRVKAEVIDFQVPCQKSE